jgi:prophage antirepressor-like protein
MSNIQLFSNDEFELSVEYIDDTFRAYGPHLARQLAFRDAYDLVRNLESDEKTQVETHRTGPVPVDQQIWWLTEPGFFRVISQRQVARIKDSETRDRVRRFQRWVFHEVLPSIRRHGAYVITEPASLTWEQTAQRLYQMYGLPLCAAQITGTLKSAGVLRQNGNPCVKYRDWFWMTGTGTVNVLDFVLPKIAAKLTETRSKMLERQQWYQLRLQLDPSP